MIGTSLLPLLGGSYSSQEQVGDDVVSTGHRLSSSTADSAPVLRLIADDPKEPNGVQTSVEALDKRYTGLPLVDPEYARPSQGSVPEVPLDEPPSGTVPELPLRSQSQPKRPFHKWVKTLHRRRAERQRLQMTHGEDQMPSTLDHRSNTVGSSSHRRQSSSVSSFAYVTAIRDASVSGFATSVEASSRKRKARSSKGQSRTDRSSRQSVSIRFSEDEFSEYRSQPYADAAVLERSRQRWRILDELIETEEGYVGDIKFLMNVGLYLRCLKLLLGVMCDFISSRS